MVKIRVLGLMRGAPGAGKTTWLKNNGLDQYSLSADDIRLLYQSPVMGLTGPQISQKNDNKVWSTLFELLEDRMARGEFTIIDATHSKTKDIQKYKHLAQKYRYRVFIIDFTDIPIEKCLEQNKMRPEYKWVPEEAIKNIYSRFKTQSAPGWTPVIHRDNFMNEISYKKIDLSSYDNIHVFGDLHGCKEPLDKYFNYNGINANDLYIFVGDYVDRGIQNAELLNKLFELSKLDNFIFLEGNHEIHLYNWASDKPILSREFKKYTAPQLESAGIDKKEARIFYRKLRQLMYFDYRGYEVLITHGGLSYIPEELIFVSTEELIKGVGDYNTNIDLIFDSNNDRAEKIQIHGHRNVFGIEPVECSSFNLEGGVERGGHLRIVQLNHQGNIRAFEIKNNIYSERMSRMKKDVKIETNDDLIEMLKSNKLIQEKKMSGEFKNISSFNFKREVFHDRLWDEQNIQARGLFINMETKEIVARSYNKFFNLGERSFTSIGALKENLKYPVDIYLKENGYLGILGYDSSTDQLIIASKSTVHGDFAEWFEEILYKTITENKIRMIKDFLKDNNCSMVFEVILPEKDPHIIKYNKDELVLLDIVYRTPEYKKMDYNKVILNALRFGFSAKQKIKVIEDWQEFREWYYSLEERDPANTPPNEQLEGYVIEDASGFCTKIKLPYYRFWKNMRSVAQKMSKKQPNVKTGQLTTPLANEFYAFLRDKGPDYVRRFNGGKNIIALREEFYKNGAE